MPLSLLSNLKDSGLLTPILGVDVILFLIAIYLAKTLIFPAITLYSKSKQLDRLIGTTPKEWFFGHAKQVFTQKFFLPKILWKHVSKQASAINYVCSFCFSSCFQV